MDPGRTRRITLPSSLRYRDLHRTRDSGYELSSGKMPGQGTGIWSGVGLERALRQYCLGPEIHCQISVLDRSQLGLGLARDGIFRD